MDSSIATGTRPGTMSPVAASRSTAGRAAGALRLAARGWFAVAAIGLSLFAVYVTLFYGGAVLRGDPAGWNKVLPKGYVAGEPLGNAVLAVHLALAVFVTLGGALQLVPQIRSAVPRVHRWIGRIYLIGVAVTSLGGTWLVWARGTVGDLTQHVAITINAVFIIVCGLLAWRHAIGRRFDVHRRWALRLFLVANGVWFFRIGLMLWLLVWQRPVGFDPKTFAGPYLSFLSFAQYLLPLAMLELYFFAQRPTRGAALRFGVAALLALLTLATAAGVFGAFLGMWLPRI
ncbi:DUF2306 domain-containing protein [Roseateles flavus]|uniref:DUF2306 domain-containing protein n=1 Tax=Roseateles flavus TaxID=3149041 RepID=A0ABV0GGN8_9BURK